MISELLLLTEGRSCCQISWVHLEGWFVVVLETRLEMGWLNYWFVLSRRLLPVLNADRLQFRRSARHHPLNAVRALDKVICRLREVWDHWSHSFCVQIAAFVEVTLETRVEIFTCALSIAPKRSSRWILPRWNSRLYRLRTFQFLWNNRWSFTPNIGAILLCNFDLKHLLEILPCHYILGLKS